MNKRANSVALWCALVFALALLIAAIGKIFYPIDMPPPWKTISLFVAGFEIVLAALLLRYHTVAALWSFIAIILGGWAGYSFFWLCAKLPCGCMGKMLDLPTGITFSFDVIFFLISLILVTKLKRFSYLTFVLALCAALLGYLAASHLFKLITL